MISCLAPAQYVPLGANSDTHTALAHRPFLNCAQSPFGLRQYQGGSVLDLDGIGALTFDVFGTVVDWRTSIASEGARIGAEKGMEGIDWVAFADSWRGGYTPSMDRVRRGELPWTNIDALHRMILG